MPRHKGGRTSEREMGIAALRILADSSRGEVTTTTLKKKMSEYIELTPGDLEPSPTRRNELMFHQIVGNIVSHRRSNLIRSGYAEYTGDGLRITAKGRAFLEKRGF